MSTTQPPKRGYTVIRGIEKLRYEFEETGVIIVYKRIPLPIFKNFVRECEDMKTKAVDFDELFCKCFDFAVLAWENVFEETESGESIPCPCVPENFQFISLEIKGIISAKAIEHIAGNRITDQIKKSVHGGIDQVPLAEPPIKAEPEQPPMNDSPSGSS